MFDDLHVTIWHGVYFDYHVAAQLRVCECEHVSAKAVLLTVIIILFCMFQGEAQRAILSAVGSESLDHEHSKAAVWKEKRTWRWAW